MTVHLPCPMGEIFTARTYSGEETDFALRGFDRGMMHGDRYTDPYIYGKPVPYETDNMDFLSPDQYRTAITLEIPDRLLLPHPISEYGIDSQKEAELGQVTYHIDPETQSGSLSFDYHHGYYRQIIHLECEELLRVLAPAMPGTVMPGNTRDERRAVYSILSGGEEAIYYSGSCADYEAPFAILRTALARTGKDPFSGFDFLYTDEALPYKETARRGLLLRRLYREAGPAFLRRHEKNGSIRMHITLNLDAGTAAFRHNALHYPDSPPDFSVDIGRCMEAMDAIARNDPQQMTERMEYAVSTLAEPLEEEPEPEHTAGPALL